MSDVQQAIVISLIGFGAIVWISAILTRILRGWGNPWLESERVMIFFFGIIVPITGVILLVIFLLTAIC